MSHVVTTIKFEPSRNEWFALQEQDGTSKRLYLKVYWPDNLEAAMVKWEQIMLALEDGPVPAEVPSGLHYADNLSTDDSCWQ